MICVASAAAALSLAASGFTLSWIHSVERVEWQERWQVDGARLRLELARIKGSGAGMEPPSAARLLDGWWTYRPDLPPQRQLLLAVSRATPSGWQMCVEGGECFDLERRLAADPDSTIRITAGPTCDRLQR